MYKIFAHFRASHENHNLQTINNLVFFFLNVYPPELNPALDANSDVSTLKVLKWSFDHKYVQIFTQFRSSHEIRRLYKRVGS